uniref:hypothetical protein n=1 Tax=Alloprevotella sp. TaxID=1872471 RepID=UPI0040279614
MSFVSSFENFKLWHKITNFVQIEQAFCRKPVACRPPCPFLLAFRRAEKGLGFTPLPEGDSGKKNDATALPQQDAVRLLQDTAQPVFCPAHLFFNEGTKILHKNCLPVSSYIVTFVSPNNHLNITYNEF